MKLLDAPWPQQRLGGGRVWGLQEPQTSPGPLPSRHRGSRGAERQNQVCRTAKGERGLCLKQSPKATGLQQYLYVLTASKNVSTCALGRNALANSGASSCSKACFCPHILRMDNSYCIRTA